MTAKATSSELAAGSREFAPAVSEPSAKAVRVAFLTNFIPPYWKPVLSNLSRSYRNLRVMVSTAMEPDRTWKVDWEGLDVVLQRTFSLPVNVRNALGFREKIYIHLPIDTLQQLRRFRAQVVISAEFGFRTVLAVLYRRLNRRSRLVVYADLSQRTESARGWVRALVRQAIVRNVDSFVVLGESGARYIRNFGVPPDRISKVPYATDVARFRQIPLIRTDESARRLLYAGRLVERKGLLPFVVALAEWLSIHPGHRAELVLAGDGPLRPALEQLARESGLQITFLGDRDYHAMPEIYAEAGIFVFPTFADTWGLVVNEAMAAGLPVLGSSHSQAVEEMVQDGSNGWTFRTDHKDEMLRAIGRSMTAPLETLAEMRERARSAALALTSEGMARRLESVIDSVWEERERALAQP